MLVNVLKAFGTILNQIYTYLARASYVRFVPVTLGKEVEHKDSGKEFFNLFTEEIFKQFWYSRRIHNTFILLSHTHLALFSSYFNKGLGRCYFWTVTPANFRERQL